jgi:hypothetical protein
VTSSTKLALLLAAAACLLPAAEHADLTPGGTVRLRNSTGELTVEGWDQPGVDITTVKSGKRADDVKVAVSHEGGDLVIATTFPRHRRFLPRPSVGAREFELSYVIRIPRDAKLAIEHDAGEIHLEGLSGDIRATMNQGTITVRTPANAAYSVDAKSRVGDVSSDLAGTKARIHLGHAMLSSASAAHGLYLRTGYGDVIILRARR